MVIENLRKSVQNSSSAVSIEKTHRRPGNTLEHVVMQVGGGFHAYGKENETPTQCEKH